MPLPPIQVIPLIPVAMDPLQDKASSTNLSNPVASIPKIQSESELVTGYQVVVNGHKREAKLVTGQQVLVTGDKKMSQGEAMLDYKSTPQYREFMEQKMLEMKAAEDRQVRLELLLQGNTSGCYLYFVNDVN